MKKTIIILAIILTSGLTALSLTRNEKKVEVAKMNADKAIIVNNKTTTINNTPNLATAD
jgi:hypothetical protein